MARRKPDKIKRFVNQLEKDAARLKSDLDRLARNADLPHRLEEIAAELRRGAVAVTTEVTHYLRDLGKASSPRKRTVKRTKKAVAKRARKTAKKATKKRARKR